MRDTLARRPEAEKRLEEARITALRLRLQERREEEAARVAKEQQRHRDRWLQTEYPVGVARDLISRVKLLSPGAKKGFALAIRDAWLAGHFKRSIFIPPLWDENGSFLVRVKPMKPPAGCGAGGERVVRASAEFLQFYRETFPPSAGAMVAPLVLTPDKMLMDLLRSTVPSATDIFVKSMTPQHILHKCGYVLDKAYIYAVIALSKWLGPDRFPQGLFETWPPPWPGLSSTGASPLPEVVAVADGSGIVPGSASGGVLVSGAAASSGSAAASSGSDAF